MKKWSASLCDWVDNVFPRATLLPAQHQFKEHFKYVFTLFPTQILPYQCYNSAEKIPKPLFDYILFSTKIISEIRQCWRYVLMIMAWGQWPSHLKWLKCAAMPQTCTFNMFWFWFTNPVIIFLSVIPRSLQCDQVLLEATHHWLHSHYSLHAVHTFNSCTSPPDVCQSLVVKTPKDNMLKKAKHIIDPRSLQIIATFSFWDQGSVFASMYRKLCGNRTCGRPTHLVQELNAGTVHGNTRVTDI